MCPDENYMKANNKKRMPFEYHTVEREKCFKRNNRKTDRVT